MKTFRFTKNEKEIHLMAIFISGIVQQGLTYTVQSDTYEFEITLTGGY